MRCRFFAKPRFTGLLHYFRGRFASQASQTHLWLRWCLFKCYTLKVVLYMWVITYILVWWVDDESWNILIEFHGNHSRVALHSISLSESAPGFTRFIEIIQLTNSLADDRDITPKLCKKWLIATESQILQMQGSVLFASELTWCWTALKILV